MSFVYKASFLLLLSSSPLLTSCASTTSKATTQLFEAVERGDISSAGQALENQAALNEVRYFRDRPSCGYGSNMSPLGVAVLHGNERMAALLLEKGADLEIPEYCRPLVLAVLANHPDMVRFLLAKGASPTYRAMQGSKLQRISIMMLAASLNMRDMIELFSQNNIDIDSVDTYGRTALFYAAEHGHGESIRTLIKHGASINHQDPDTGHTALVIAVLSQQYEAVRVLLTLGADPNIPYQALGLTSIRNGTALGIARQGGNQEIADLLMQAGAKE